MPKFEKPRLLSDRELNILRGKSLVGKVSSIEVCQILGHLLMLEAKLDAAECDDTFGTEGWRHFFGIPEDASYA